MSRVKPELIEADAYWRLPPSTKDILKDLDNRVLGWWSVNGVWVVTGGDMDPAFMPSDASVIMEAAVVLLHSHHWRVRSWSMSRMQTSEATISFFGSDDLVVSGATARHAALLMLAKAHSVVSVDPGAVDRPHILGQSPKPRRTLKP